MRWWILLLPLAGLWPLVTAWPNWVVMAAAVMSMLAALKIIALVDYERRENRSLALLDMAAWFFAWPGLNPREFFSPAPAGEQPPTVWQWLGALCKMFGGGALAFAVAPRVAERDPLSGGWVAMVGLIFLLHFGGFHLVALAWRRAGRNVWPIMNAPILATSLSEFWSDRWNLAFRDFASGFVLRPLARRWGITAAWWGCFLFSGLVHELAISGPARAGYGLPTAYFLLQAAGVSFERRWHDGKKRIMERGTWSGWLYTLAFVGPATFVLFPPPFVRRVILPMIFAFTGTGGAWP